MDMIAYRESALESEALVLDVLRRLFLEGPTMALQEALALMDRAGLELPLPMAEGLDRMCEAVASDLDRGDERCLDLQAEFARLLVGPSEPPALPYASCYLSPTRALMTDETLAVREGYLKAGLVVQQLHRIPDDHLGIELGFLFFLTSTAAQAAGSGDGEMVMRRLAERRSFLDQHFSRWAPRFAERLIRATEEPYFHGAGGLVKAVAEAPLA